VIAPSKIIAQKEESRAKNREYQRDRYVALPNHKKEEFREKNREYQRSRRVRLKAEAEITDSRMYDKGNSCKRKRDIASQVDNIGILLWFLLSTFWSSFLFLLFALYCWYCSF